MLGLLFTFFNFGLTKTLQPLTFRQLVLLVLDTFTYFLVFCRPALAGMNLIRFHAHHLDAKDLDRAKNCTLFVMFSLLILSLDPGVEWLIGRSVLYSAARIGVLLALSDPHLQASLTVFNRCISPLVLRHRVTVLEQCTLLTNATHDKEALAVLVKQTATVVGAQTERVKSALRSSRSGSRDPKTTREVEMGRLSPLLRRKSVDGRELPCVDGKTSPRHRSSSPAVPSHHTHRRAPRSPITIARPVVTRPPAAWAQPNSESLAQHVSYPLHPPVWEEQRIPIVGEHSNSRHSKIDAPPFIAKPPMLSKAAKEPLLTKLREKKDYLDEI